MTTDLDKLLDFVRFTHEIRNVQRAIHFESDERQENDMEHGYQLALVAWYLIENDNLKLDKSRCLELALAHDTVEVYAGDVPAHSPEALSPEKQKREALAAKRLKKDWPTFKSFHEAIEEYKTRQTPEAKFIYALDKIIPILNVSLYDGRSWHLLDISLEEIKELKPNKVKISPTITAYYKELIKMLEQKPELFGSKK